MGNEINKVLKGLFIGNLKSASDSTELLTHGITHILAIYEDAVPLVKGIDYMCLPVSDSLTIDIARHFPQTNDFIHEARMSGGSVLVHCHAGVSRSVTIVTAYLMTVADVGWREALMAVKNVRPFANPNFNFQQQLRIFKNFGLAEERKRLLSGKPSVDRLVNDRGEVLRLVESYRRTHFSRDSDSDIEDLLNVTAFIGSHSQDGASSFSSAGSVLGSVRSRPEMKPIMGDDLERLDILEISGRQSPSLPRGMTHSMTHSKLTAASNFRRGILLNNSAKVRSSQSTMEGKVEKEEYVSSRTDVKHRKVRSDRLKRKRNSLMGVRQCSVGTNTEAESCTGSTITGSSTNSDSTNSGSTNTQWQQQEVDNTSTSRRQQQSVATSTSLLDTAFSSTASVRDLGATGSAEQGTNVTCNVSSPNTVSRGVVKSEAGLTSVVPSSGAASDGRGQYSRGGNNYVTLGPQVSGNSGIESAGIDKDSDAIDAIFAENSRKITRTGRKSSSLVAQHKSSHHGGKFSGSQGSLNQSSTNHISGNVTNNRGSDAVGVISEQGRSISDGISDRTIQDVVGEDLRRKDGQSGGAKAASKSVIRSGNKSGVDSHDSSNLTDTIKESTHKQQDDVKSDSNVGERLWNKSVGSHHLMSETVRGLEESEGLRSESVPLIGGGQTMRMGSVDSVVGHNEEESTSDTVSKGRVGQATDVDEVLVKESNHLTLPSERPAKSHSKASHWSVAQSTQGVSTDQVPAKTHSKASHWSVAQSTQGVSTDQVPAKTHSKASHRSMAQSTQAVGTDQVPAKTHSKASHWSVAQSTQGVDTDKVPAKSYSKASHRSMAQSTQGVSTDQVLAKSHSKASHRSMAQSTQAVDTDRVPAKSHSKASHRSMAQSTQGVSTDQVPAKSHSKASHWSLVQSIQGVSTDQVPEAGKYERSSQAEEKRKETTTRDEDIESNTVARKKRVRERKKEKIRIARALKREESRAQSLAQKDSDNLSCTGDTRQDAANTTRDFVVNDQRGSEVGGSGKNPPETSPVKHEIILDSVERERVMESVEHERDHDREKSVGSSARKDTRSRSRLIAVESRLGAVELGKTSRTVNEKVETPGTSGARRADSGQVDIKNVEKEQDRMVATVNDSKRGKPHSKRGKSGNSRRLSEADVAAGLVADSKLNIGGERRSSLSRRSVSFSSQAIRRQNSELQGHSGSHSKGKGRGLSSWNKNGRRKGQENGHEKGPKNGHEKGQENDNKKGQENDNKKGQENDHEIGQENGHEHKTGDEHHDADLSKGQQNNHDHGHSIKRDESQSHSQANGLGRSNKGSELGRSIGRDDRGVLLGSAEEQEIGSSRPSSKNSLSRDGLGSVPWIDGRAKSSSGRSNVSRKTVRAENSDNLNDRAKSRRESNTNVTTLRLSNASHFSDATSKLSLSSMVRANKKKKSRKDQTDREVLSGKLENGSSRRMSQVSRQHLPSSQRRSSKDSTGLDDSHTPGANGIKSEASQRTFASKRENKNKENENSRSNEHKKDRTKEYDINKTKEQENNNSKELGNSKNKEQARSKTKKRRENKTKEHEHNKTEEHEHNKIKELERNQTKEHEHNQSQARSEPRHERNRAKEQIENKTNELATSRTKKHENNNTRELENNKSEEYSRKRTKEQIENRTKEQANNRTTEHENNKTNKPENSVRGRDQIDGASVRDLSLMFNETRASSVASRPMSTSHRVGGEREGGRLSTTVSGSLPPWDENSKLGKEAVRRIGRHYLDLHTRPWTDFSELSAVDR